MQIEMVCEIHKKCIEPIVQKGYANQREYSYADVDIQECALENTTEYNGKINPIITIFAYTEVKPKQEQQHEELINDTNLIGKVEEFKKDNGIKDSQIDISQEELPFY